jgi:nucleoid-associated protein YgaU
VKSGDTLTAIGARQSPKVSATSLYNKNKTKIEAVAKSHGYSSSDHGHWIFPGTVLTIP